MYISFNFYSIALILFLFYSSTSKYYGAVLTFLISSAMLAYDRANVGRGGEVYFASWKTTHWSYEDDVLETETFQPKTGKICQVCIARDKEEWALDPSS